MNHVIPDHKPGRMPHHTGDNPPCRPPTLLEIQEVASRLWGASIMDIRSRRQDPLTLSARYGVVWLSKRLTPCSLAEIGRSIGDRDHTTIMHAAHRGADRMQSDPDFLERVNMALTILESRETAFV